MKRIGLFIATNLAIVIMISVIMRVFGLGHYLTPYGVDYTSLAVYCSLWGFGGAFVSLLISKWVAKKFMGVQIVDEDAQYESLVKLVHKIARKADLTVMPEVGVFQSQDLNAFATGPSKKNSLVAVSSGLLNSMNANEIEGVLAHEVAHIANGDMVTLTLVQGVVNSFVFFLAKIASLAMRGDNDKGHSNFFVEIMFRMIFAFFGAMIVAWFSRQREYRADAGAAYLSSKDNMIAALKKLQSFYPNLEEMETESTSAMSMKISSRKARVSLHSSHPALEDRIAALNRIS